MNQARVHFDERHCENLFEAIYIQHRPITDYFVEIILLTMTIEYDFRNKPEQKEVKKGAVLIQGTAPSHISR